MTTGTFSEWRQAVTLPEMAALRVMAFLRQHSCQEIHHKEDSIALVTLPNMLTIMAAWTCNVGSGICSETHHPQTLDA